MARLTTCGLTVHGLSTATRMVKDFGKLPIADFIKEIEATTGVKRVNRAFDVTIFTFEDNSQIKVEGEETFYYSDTSYWE